jgi:tetratricopeptide (TPR) repeat protein
VVLLVLQNVPLVGALFKIPFLGFWGAAILVSVGLSWLANRAVQVRTIRSRTNELGATNTPHNQGKLGSLLQQNGSNRKAIAPLRNAVEGDPGVADWPYRLGCALLATGDARAAVDALRQAAAIDEEHKFGQVLLRLAEAEARSGLHEESLDTLARFERNHGPGPEWAYRRGVALSKAGRKQEARESFDDVGKLASRVAGFQKKGARGWVVKAFLARW